MNKTTELLNLIKWMAIQAQLQLAPQSQFPERKQIWWACLGQNIGIETNGKNYRFERPVLVIKAFNACALFVAPLTSTLGTHQFLIEFNHLGQKKSVNVSQLRTLSAKRFTKRSPTCQMLILTALFHRFRKLSSINLKPRRAGFLLSSLTKWSKRFGKTFQSLLESSNNGGWISKLYSPKMRKSRLRIVSSCIHWHHIKIMLTRTWLC